jgi:hypothetical protein
MGFEKVDPKFRELTDLLLFSNRTDLDFSNYKALLKQSTALHIRYIIHVLENSSKIYWDNAEDLWYYRSNVLLSLNINSLTLKLANVASSGINYIFFKKNNKLNYDYIEVKQFLGICRALKNNKKGLFSFREDFAMIVSSTKFEDLFNIIKLIVPVVFDSVEDYIDLISGKIVKSNRNIDFLLYLEKYNYSFDRDLIVNLFFDILENRNYTSKNIKALFAIMGDPKSLSQISARFNDVHKRKFLNYLKASSKFYLNKKNVSNILLLHNSMSDDVADVFVGLICDSLGSNTNANTNKLISLIKDHPELSAKKMLLCISKLEEKKYIKSFVKAFPELKAISLFI